MKVRDLNVYAKDPGDLNGVKIECLIGHLDLAVHLLKVWADTGVGLPARFSVERSVIPAGSLIFAARGDGFGVERRVTFAAIESGDVELAIEALANEWAQRGGERGAA